MTAPVRSAYPVPLEDLLPKARELAEELGQVPSRNRLMSEFRIGARKANTLRNQLGETSNVRPPHPSQDIGEAAEEITQPRPVLPADPPETEYGIGSQPVAATFNPPTPQPAAEETSGRTGRVGSPAPYSDTASVLDTARRVPVWPVVLLALPAFVAIWSGWVGLGGLTGFGVVHLLPGIADRFTLNTAITLPIGVETYAAYALRVWLSGQVPARARRFAKRSAIASLVVGALGQIAYHLMTAAGVTVAPWWITTVVACLPVAVLGMGAALAHLLHSDDGQEVSR
jgi:hypothetical protein